MRNPDDYNNYNDFGLQPPNRNRRHVTDRMNEKGTPIFTPAGNNPEYGYVNPQYKKDMAEILAEMGFGRRR